MDLREFLFRTRMTQRKFAKVLRITDTYLRDIMKGRHRASLRLAEDIQRHTEGQVTVDEIRKPIAGKKEGVI